MKRLSQILAIVVSLGLVATARWFAIQYYPDIEGPYLIIRYLSFLTVIISTVSFAGVIIWYNFFTD